MTRPSLVSRSAPGRQIHRSTLLLRGRTCDVLLRHRLLRQPGGFEGCDVGGDLLMPTEEVRARSNLALNLSACYPVASLGRPSPSPSP
jgi:hypothetical protein